MTGSVFYIYVPTINTSYLFSRFSNMPAIPDKLLRIWLASNFDKEYFHVATTQFVLENNIPTAYAVFVGKGNLKSEGSSLVWSYDDAKDATSTIPTGIIMTVNF